MQRWNHDGELREPRIGTSAYLARQRIGPRNCRQSVDQHPSKICVAEMGGKLGTDFDDRKRASMELQRKNKMKEKTEKIMGLF
jgi:hypothetical protein